MSKKKKKIPSALKPSASEDKKLRSVHLATVQMTWQPHKHMHSPADSENRETDGQEHFCIYDGGIMCKLGLKKAPMGQSPTERAVPMNELVQLELREGNATTRTNTTALYIIHSYYIMIFQTGTLTQKSHNLKYNGK